MGLLSLFDQAADSGRRGFLKQLVGSVATAAAVPAATQNHPIQERSPISVTAPVLTARDAADTLYRLFTEPSLATQIIYAARATHAAQLLIHQHLKWQRISRFEDNVPKEFFEHVFPQSLQLAVNLSLSGMPSWMEGTNRTPVEAHPNVVHLARIAGLGIPVSGGLHFPLYSPSGTDSSVTYDPSIIYRVSAGLSRHDEIEGEDVAKAITRSALRRGMAPELVPAFMDVLNERSALLVELHERGAPQRIDPTFRELGLLASRFSLRFEESDPRWDEFMEECGGVLGLAVNLPVTLKALKALEDGSEDNDSHHKKIMGAILNQSLEASRWLQAFQPFKTLLDLQPVFAKIANPYHPPTDVLCRHGDFIERSVALLEEAGVPNHQIGSPLSSEGCNDFMSRLRERRSRIFEQLRSRLDQPNHRYQEDRFNSVHVLASSTFGEPIRYLLGDGSHISTRYVQTFETRREGVTTSLWRQVLSTADTWHLEEVHLPNIKLA